MLPVHDQNQVVLPGGVQQVQGNPISDEATATPQRGAPAMTGTPRTIEQQANKPQPQHRQSRPANRRGPNNIRKLLENSKAVTQNPSMMQTILSLLGPKTGGSPSLGDLIRR